MKQAACCPYCGLDLQEFLKKGAKANHIRWCAENPKATEYRRAARKRVAEIPALNKNRSLELRMQISLKIKELHKEGRYLEANNQKRGRSTLKNGHHSDKTKELLRQKALADPRRRIRRQCIIYHTKDGKEVLLDSLDIEWIRPPPVLWVDLEGRYHHYFPDFYLPKYYTYLDPKNPIVETWQKVKLDILKKQINLVILRSVKECETYIPSISEQPSKL